MIGWKFLASHHHQKIWGKKWWMASRAVSTRKKSAYLFLCWENLIIFQGNLRMTSVKVAFAQIVQILAKQMTLPVTAWQFFRHCCLPAWHAIHKNLLFCERTFFWSYLKSNNVSDITVGMKHTPPPLCPPPPFSKPPPHSAPFQNGFLLPSNKHERSIAILCRLF